MTTSGNLIDRNRRMRRKQRYETIVQQNTHADKRGQYDKKRQGKGHPSPQLGNIEKNNQRAKTGEADKDRTTEKNGRRRRGGAVHVKQLTAADHTGQAVMKDRDTTRSIYKGKNITSTRQIEGRHHSRHHTVIFASVGARALTPLKETTPAGHQRTNKTSM